MPAQSESQRRYLYAKFGAAWVRKHHFDNPGPLPTYVTKKKTSTERLAERLAERSSRG